MRDDEEAENDACVEETADVIGMLGGRLLVETASVAVQVISGT